MSVFSRGLASRFGISAVLTAGALSLSALSAPAQTITINETKNRVAINPNIYGVSNDYNNSSSDLPTTADTSGMNVSVVRKGGNLDSTYNWLLDSFNHGLDYYFESSPDAGGNGSVADSFVSRIQSGGGKPMLTIPMINYVATNGWSFSVSKYGYTPIAPSYYYQAGSPTDPYNSDAGSGVISYNPNTNANIYFKGNNPTDANTANSPTFQKSWVQHLIAQHNTATNGGVPYYILDNEPDDWHDEHADGNPVGVTLKGLSSAGIPASSGLESLLETYSKMVKTVDPSAHIVGPEIGGNVWYGYFLSGYDLYRYNQFYDSSDTEYNTYTKGGILPQLLSDLNTYDTSHGTKTLDVCSVHYYPQNGEYSDAVDTATQQLRNKSTRALWDTTYVDPAFNGSGLSDGAGTDVVQLFPALRGWIAKYYPGLQTGLTEYSWGADGHMNGATAQADILGIMGRGLATSSGTNPGLDMATRFTSPASGTPVYKAFQMYRNYDGSKSTFGNISVACTSSGNTNNLSAFASNTTNGTFSGHDLTVMVVNKQLPGTSAASLTINLTLQSGCYIAAGTTAQPYRLAAIGTDPTNATITKLSTIPVSSTGFTATVPAQSVTLYKVHVAYTWLHIVHLTVVSPALQNLLQTQFANLISQKYANISFMDSATGRLVDQSGAVYFDTSGNLYVGTNASGTFNIAVTPAGGLTQTFRNVSVSDSNPNMELGNLSLLLGDVNGDNSVDLTDYSAVLGAYGKTYLDSGFNAAYDIDGDGVIGANDLGIIKANFRMKGN